MTDSERLKSIIADSGLKFSYIAEKIGLKSPTSLYNKIDNRTEFTVSEVSKLCEVLGITKMRDQKEIFFANNVHKT